MKRMPKDILLPSDPSLLGGVFHCALYLLPRHYPTGWASIERQDPREVRRNFFQFPSIVFTLRRREVDQGAVQFDFRPIEPSHLLAPEPAKGADSEEGKPIGVECDQKFLHFCWRQNFDLVLSFNA